MADTKVPATGSKLKVPPIINIEQPLPNEKVWEYQRRVLQSQINKGSRYPPFSIEPMPWERQRVSTPMTAEDRFLRKQWLQDQNLSPNEPRFVSEAKPMCRPRRIIRMPWDMAQRAMAKFIGAAPAELIRICVPKLMIGYVVALVGLYHVSFNPKSWETHHGVMVYGARRPRWPGEDNSYHVPEVETYNLRGFENRKSHFNTRTSAQGQ